MAEPPTPGDRRPRDHRPGDRPRRRRSPERRRPLRRRPRTARADAFTDFGRIEHHSWTFEGQIEQIGGFARTVNGSRGWRRWTGKLVLAAPLLGLLAAGVVWVVIRLVGALA